MATPAPTLILYHADCPDGFGAAWSYWRKYGPAARYEPYYYDQKRPPGIEGEDVIMVDVSAPAARLWEIHDHARTFRLIDHHESAATDLATLPFAQFDLAHSGAVLGWRDAWGTDEPLPRLLRLIQARDLWTWDEAGAWEALLVLDTLPRTFEAWDAFHDRLTHDFAGVQAEGAVMDRQYQALMTRFIRQAVPITIAGLPGKLVNIPHVFANDVGAALCQEVPIAITWYLGADGLAHLSLRAEKDHFNLIPVAQALGGGGHKGSGGARLPLDRLAAMHRGEDVLGDCEGLKATMAVWHTRLRAHWKQLEAIGQPFAPTASPPRRRPG